jgi:hypothetical protein
MNRQKRERRSGMPMTKTMTKTIFIAGIAAVMLSNFESLALGQNDPQASPFADTQHSFDRPADQAQPAFRVQPMLRDLPPGVAETETQRTKAQKDFDKTLQICRDC